MWEFTIMTLKSLNIHNSFLHIQLKNKHSQNRYNSKEGIIQLSHKNQL